MLALSLILILAAAQKAEPEAAQDAAALAEGRALLAELAASSVKTKILAAEFVQTQSSLLFEEPVISRGKMFLRAEPGTLVMRAEQPEAIWMRSDATSHQVWHRGKARAERFLFRENEMATALLRCLGAGVETLEKSFRILDAQRTEQGGKIVLEPLEERLRTAMVRLELRTVKDETGVWLAGVFYENPEKETTLIEFSALARNPELKAKELEEIFSAALPAEVKVLTHDLRNKAPDKPGKRESFRAP